VVIPKYEDKPSNDKGIYQPEKSNVRESGHGAIVPHLQMDFKAKGKSAIEKKETSDSLVKKGAPELPTFTANFQIGDAKKIEPEYILSLPHPRLDYESIRQQEDKSGAEVSHTSVLS
jgi:hypothetical protein